MKQLVMLLLLFTYLHNSYAQNVAMNMLTQNNGQVDVGSTVFLEVTISNTNASSTVGNYRLKPIFTVPNSVVIPSSGHILPTGWTILNGLAGQPPTLPGQVLRVSNGTSTLPPNTSVTLLIAIQGVSYAPSTVINGALQFSNGVAPGTGNGTLTGNNTGDDNPTATVEVISTVPLQLSDFKASVANCEPTLKWTTEQEVNTNRFEIERSTTNMVNNSWNKIGEVAAAGSSSIRKNYTYKDNAYPQNYSRQLYRLKMIDNDNTFTYSKVIVVTNNCEKTSAIISPNPIKGSLNISIAGFANNIRGILYSSEGKLIISNPLTNGTNNIDINNIPNGIYLYVVEDIEGKTSKQKVVIQN